MKSKYMNSILLRLCLVAGFLAGFGQAVSAQAQLYQLTLKNGMKFEGKYSRTGDVSKDLSVINPDSGGVSLKTNVIVDDGLRRTFFPFRNLQSQPIQADPRTVIKIKQRTSTARERVANLGAVFAATPFDKYGRRTISVMSNGGSKKIPQEITQISPVFTRLQSPTFNWDMRISTSSIPSDQLKAVLLQNGGNTADTRLDLVRLLFMSNRYLEAANELSSVIKDFPELDKENLERQRQALIQQYSDLILGQIAKFRKAGQHEHAKFLLNGFNNTGAATESLIQANDILNGYQKSENQEKRILRELAPLVETAEGDPPRLKMISQLHEEIVADLNISNLPRMADFLNLVGGDGLTKDEQLAMAISGWLLGGQGDVIQNLGTAASLLEVRNLVREYLRAMGKENRHIREELLARIKDREGGTPEYVEKILANMKPPLDLPPGAEIPGLYHVDVPGTHPDFPVQYSIQLPPEYDPYMRYPVVVSLHAAGAKPEGQITWWAGDYNKDQQRRVGQATRHGYIVIAPAWTKPKQGVYEYSEREHDIVLASLRDAQRRVSIDTDRVFISGHATGGDAAWDIALAHPDLWAGTVLIGARGDYGKSAPQYVTFYDENAKNFPIYLVNGSLDGRKWHENSIHMNRYLRPGYDSIFVQYQGRGNEHFYEEIQRIFEWLELHQRRPIPKKFEVNSMRPRDKDFWYVEVTGLPPKTMSSPYEWPLSRKPISAKIEGSVLANNGIRVKSGAARTTVWLSPEIIDFDKRIAINRKKCDAIPSLEVILEDARQRADRQHVYWAKVTFP